MRKKNILLAVLAVLAAGIIFLCIYKAPMAKKITWGAAFSQKHAVDMGLDWKENYLAMLDDLKISHLKIAAHWDLVEPRQESYEFGDLDWQLEQAQNRGAKVMLAVGMKTPRWPECHIPEWAKDIGKERQQEAILKMLEAVVSRYGDNGAIISWQVENEPLFPFGQCPWVDEKFLAREAKVVRSLDVQKRPVVISDSGEGSWWFKAGKIGDQVGVTMYRRVFFHELKTYVTYPIPPAFYWVKSRIIAAVFKKPVICAELQAEPWAANQVYDGSDGDAKTMDIKQLRSNIEFAKNTGLDTFYLWGSEWWYWMKTKHQQPQYWEEVKKIWN